MKNTLLVIVVLLVGCATPLTPEQKALRDSVIGVYEKDPVKLYFWEDGKAEAFVNGVKAWTRRWSIRFVEGEVLIFEDTGWDYYEAEAHRINKDGSITWVASIRKGKRIERLKDRQSTYQKNNIPHLP